MNRNSNAAEGKSAAQRWDAERASNSKNCSMNIERILFCDAKGAWLYQSREKGEVSRKKASEI